VKLEQKRDSVLKDLMEQMVMVIDLVAGIESLFVDDVLIDVPGKMQGAFQGKQIALSAAVFFHPAAMVDPFQLVQKMLDVEIEQRALLHFQVSMGEGMELKIAGFPKHLDEQLAPLDIFRPPDPFPPNARQEKFVRKIKRL